MSLAHQSIATINSPQFINLQPLDINPLMSSCQIKVLYIGENRNKSYISKQVATEMSKTLRGAPIVGYYKKDKEDFADHGQQVIFDDEGIHFNCLTKPYGFVSPDAKVWFQDFQDQDDFGNNIVRTYLMTTGYLWTEQFKEADQILKDNGKPQSMELQSESIKGKWSNNIKEDVEFFIINDAIFSKLCILGDDVEPCFEGAAITPSQVSKTFALDKNFKQTLFDMMQELTFALKGGNAVDKEKNQVLNVEKEEPTIYVASSEEKIQDNFEQTSSTENEVVIEDPTFNFEKTKQEDQDEEKDTSAEEKEEEKEEDKKEKDKYTKLENDFKELQNKYSALNSELENLRTFKENIENEQKDELIKQFYMLSDEDKQDVINNKTKYSLDEIKSKLAVICFEKKVNFNLVEASEKESEDDKKIITTFDVNNGYDSTPDWVKAVESTMNKI